MNRYSILLAAVFGLCLSLWAFPIVDLAEQLEKGNVDYFVPATGFLYLLILVCLWWWYGIFLDRVCPASDLKMYAWDFVTFAVFAVAARLWNQADYFWLVAGLGSLLMLGRFFWSLFHTSTRERAGDKKALIFVLVVVGVTAVVLIPTGIAYWFGAGVWPEHFFVITTIVFMVMGICVTWIASRLTQDSPPRTREGATGARLDPASAILLPMRLMHEWPDDWNNEQIKVVVQQVGQAQTDFVKMVSSVGEYPHRSCVHSFGDVVTQAYVLAIPSVDRPREIYCKAWLTFAGHWLDDLFDQNLGRKIAKMMRSNRPFEVSDLFQRSEDDRIALSVLSYMEENCVKDKPMFRHGMRRLMMGSVLLDARWRDPAFVKEHKKMIVAPVIGDDVIREIDEIDEQLWILTTKTVQELWLSCEEGWAPANDQKWALAMLYSVLFAPALYYHDNVLEGDLWQVDVAEDGLHVESMEIAINVSANMIVKYEDERRTLRAQQTRVVGRAFRHCMSSKLVEAYEAAADVISG